MDGSRIHYAPHAAPFVRVGAFGGCGFRVFFRPAEAWSDERLLAALGVVPVSWDGPVDRRDHALSIADHRGWIHVNDDYGLWNSGRWKMAIRPLPRYGEALTFLLPDPDMAYRFAMYRGGARVRLRVVDSPAWSDQILRVEEGAPLAGEPPSWAGEPMPILEAIARGLGIDTEAPVRARLYRWRPW